MWIHNSNLTSICFYIFHIAIFHDCEKSLWKNGPQARSCYRYSYRINEETRKETKTSCGFFGWFEIATGGQAFAFQKLKFLIAIFIFWNYFLKWWILIHITYLLKFPLIQMTNFGWLIQADLINQWMSKGIPKEKLLLSNLWKIPSPDPIPFCLSCPSPAAIIMKLGLLKMILSVQSQLGKQLI